MLQDVLQSLIVVTIIILLSTVIKKANEFINKIIIDKNLDIDTKVVDSMMQSFSDAVTKAIIATNQTYVNDLKKQGKFDADAMKEAMKKTIDYCKIMLADDVLDYIEVNYTDVDELIEVVAETIIGLSKTESSGDVKALVDTVTVYLSQLSGDKKYSIEEIIEELRSKLGVTE